MRWCAHRRCSYSVNRGCISPCNRCRAAAYQQKNHLHRLPLQGGPSAGHGRPRLCGHPPLQAGNSGGQRYFAGKAAGSHHCHADGICCAGPAADEGAGREIPVVAARVRSQLENGWEPTMALLEQAVAEGVMRPVSLPVLRQMITASIESFSGRPQSGRKAGCSMWLYWRK